MIKLSNEAMAGKKFGRLTVIRLDYRKPSGQSYWIFKCDCGQEKSINIQNVKSGLQNSCGCLLLEYRQEMRERNIEIRKRNAILREERKKQIQERKKNKRINFINSFIGNRYGKLTVVSFIEKIKRHNFFLFRCDCGNELRLELRYVRLQRNNEYCESHCPFYEQYWIEKDGTTGPAHGKNTRTGQAGKTPIRFYSQRRIYGHSLFYWQQTLKLTRQRIHQLYQRGMLPKRIEQYFQKQQSVEKPI